MSSSVELLTPHEVRINGRKFLYKNSNLYTIHDRESDEDYDPDEEWSFEAWCGPQVHDLAVLQHWIAFLCQASTPSEPKPETPKPEEPENPKDLEICKETKRWVLCGADNGADNVADKWMFRATHTHAGLHLLCSLGDAVWMSEYTNSELMIKADKDGYCGSLEEYLDVIHFGVGCESYKPIFTISADKQSVEIEIALIVCEEYTFVAWFTLQATQIPKAVQTILRAQMPAKPVLEVQQEVQQETQELTQELPVEITPPTPAPKVPQGRFTFRGVTKKTCATE